MDLILRPLQDDVAQFQERIDRMLQERASLDTKIDEKFQQMQQSTTKLDKQANNLVTALTTKPKTRGNWGETTLIRLLEDSGLKAETDFLVQPSYANGKLKPDVVIKLP